MQIEIYHRSAKYINLLFPFWKLHPILKDEKGIYYELINYDWEIHILSGTKKEISESSRRILKTKIKPDKIINVDYAIFKRKFKEFKKLHEGKPYRFYDFKTNCIGFERYVLKGSKKK